MQNSIYKSIITIFLILGAALFLTLLHAQPMYIGELRPYKMPELLTYSGKVGNSNIKGLAKLHKERQHGFYPIGWSRDDRFAFLIDYATHPAQDTHYIELVIQNVLYNDVVYSWRGSYITPDSLDEEPAKNKAIHNDHIVSTWKRYYTALRRKLNEFNIKQPATFNWLIGNSFSYNSDSYKIETELATHPITGDPAAKITLSCSKGSRFMFVKNNTVEDIEKIDVHGTLISPYEERGVVLIELTFKGDSEKEPKRQLRLVGFDLINNFEKPK
jgi:hypothetical protein